MDDVEGAIREAHARGDFSEAVRLGISAYGVEVYSFLCARLRSEADAHDVYSQLTEDVVRGIAAFQWRSSFRTWLYTLARHAAVRFERSPANQAARRTPLSQISDPVVVERSRTRPYQRTDVKDRFAALRERLSPDEQSLLVLRIDRDLGWEEVAAILYDDSNADDDTRKRHAANVRQRFRQLKTKLEQWARSEGLLDE